MLKNIRLHVEKDEEKQALLEEKLATTILSTHHENINSFTRNIPSLLPLVQSPKLQSHSLFCNKFGEINIVDYGVGRTLYNFHPQQEISEQVKQFIKHPPYISLSKKTLEPASNSQANGLTQLDAYNRNQAFAPCTDNIECLVVLGCGLGTHIYDLVKQRKIKYIIVYEPETQYFQCSVLVTKWHEIFKLAKLNNTQLFLQIGKDGRDLLSDIAELNDNIGIQGFYLYKHYNHPVFNALELELTSRPWSKLTENGISFSFQEDHNQYTPTWTPCIDLPSHTTCSTESTRYIKNLEALKKYFPNIYSEFKDYQAKTWVPIQSADGQINVIKKDSLTPWYSNNPKQDCLYNYENYNEQPHKDGLVLGYKGTKLAHYLHYQFVKETEELLTETEEELGALPEHIASIILFGLGVGYQLETLLEKHSVEKLFLCEPNRDFFYASLFAIDWQHIFETVDNSKARIYLNIGDDGSHLFRDLLGQFHSIGPYILNNTYFYQSYYNASLNSAIAQLREQLQIVISMGEYFDHAYYGIEHTKEGFRRNIPVLTKNPSSKLNYDDKEVPVFIVGNGPSLDLSIEAIKEWKDQAIIISCGTALQALHKHGITPDFHAEIEQNRSTYDWAVLIGDLEYLKQITLISCNGIHPDTCDLYKDVLVAFKEGESSTVSALTILGEENVEKLQNAFPTVSNFVTNLISVIGFNHIYLMGVDLGFVDVKHHHSKSSGYYQEDGKETYDYAKSNNTSLVVPGNFRPTVNTKHEFKISRQIIEQVTQQKSKFQTFYNCSDGAKIQGTNPLILDNLLIMSTTQDKAHALRQVKSVIFSTEYNTKFIERYENKFSSSILIKELTALQDLLEQKISTVEQANDLINKQKELLFASYQNGQSLLFYYLYGTMNYANAVLTKLLHNKSSITSIAPRSFKQANKKWLDTLKIIKQMIIEKEFDDFDTSHFNLMKRESKSLHYNCRDCSILFVTDSIVFKESIKFVLAENFSWVKNVEFINSKEIVSYLGVPDYVVYDLKELINIPVRGLKNTIVNLKPNAPYLSLAYDGISFIKEPPFIKEISLNNPIFLAKVTILACLSNSKCNLIIPKFRTCDTTKQEKMIADYLDKSYEAFDYNFYISLFSKNNEKVRRKSSNSETRPKKIVGALKVKHLIYQRMEKIEFIDLQKTTNNVMNSLLKNN
tara:strand:+ start:4376 stop:7900 length:3525 start_codon:yes stop_codon:yes gene_type:complete